MKLFILVRCDQRDICTIVHIKYVTNLSTAITDHVLTMKRIIIETEAERAVQVRLVGNNNDKLKGRLEVLYNGTWGYACNHKFGYDDADVVCRQMGFSRVSQTKISDHKSDQIWLRNVNCNGQESSITSCPHDAWGVGTSCKYIIIACYKRK